MVSEVFDKWQIQESEYVVLAGFDESLIKSGIGYLEQIHVFVTAEVNANSPLLRELGRIFSPFSSILFTPSSWHRMPVYKARTNGDVWDFDELIYFTASIFANGGSSAKHPLTIISLSQTRNPPDGPTGFSHGGSGGGEGEKREKRGSEKGKERDRGDGDKDDNRGKHDPDPDSDPEDPSGDQEGTVSRSAKISFEIVSVIQGQQHSSQGGESTFQTLAVHGSLTIKVPIEKGKVTEETLYDSTIVDHRRNGIVWWSFNVDDDNFQKWGNAMTKDVLPSVSFAFVGHEAPPKSMDIMIASHWSMIQQKDDPSWISKLFNRFKSSGDSHWSRSFGNTETPSYSNLFQVVAMKTVPSDLPEWYHYHANLKMEVSSGTSGDPNVTEPLQVPESLVVIPRVVDGR